MLVPGSVDILDTCHASLPPYKCWEGAALLLKHFPVRVHHLHVMGLPSDCSASAAVGGGFLMVTSQVLEIRHSFHF